MKNRRHGTQGEKIVVDRWQQLDKSAHRDRSKADEYEGEKADKDIETRLPFVIQTKAGKAPSPYKALREATRYAQNEGRGEVPVAVLNFLRSSRADFRDGRKCLRLAVLHFDDFVELIEAMVAEDIY